MFYLSKLSHQRKLIDQLSVDIEKKNTEICDLVMSWRKYYDELIIKLCDKIEKDEAIQAIHIVSEANKFDQTIFTTHYKYLITEKHMLIKQRDKLIQTFL